MNSKNKHLLKKLNNEELKNVNGGFYYCIINDEEEDAIILSENGYEDRIVKYLGEEMGASAAYIAYYLSKEGYKGNVLHLSKWEEVEAVIAMLQQLSVNQVNV